MNAEIIRWRNAFLNAWRNITSIIRTSSSSLVHSYSMVAQVFLNEGDGEWTPAWTADWDWRIFSFWWFVHLTFLCNCYNHMLFCHCRNKYYEISFYIQPQWQLGYIRIQQWRQEEEGHNVTIQVPFTKVLLEMKKKCSVWKSYNKRVRKKLTLLTYTRYKI